MTEFCNVTHEASQPSLVCLGGQTEKGGGGRGDAKGGSGFCGFLDIPQARGGIIIHSLTLFSRGVAPCGFMRNRGLVSLPPGGEGVVRIRNRCEKTRRRLATGRQTAQQVYGTPGLRACRPVVGRSAPHVPYVRIDFLRPIPWTAARTSHIILPYIQWHLWWGVG